LKVQHNKARRTNYPSNLQPASINHQPSTINLRPRIPAEKFRQAHRQPYIASQLQLSPHKSGHRLQTPGQ
jgi:hypothetical protein